MPRTPAGGRRKKSTGSAKARGGSRRNRDGSAGRRGPSGGRRPGKGSVGRKAGNGSAGSRRQQRGSPIRRPTESPERGRDRDEPVVIADSPGALEPNVMPSELVPAPAVSAQSTVATNASLDISSIKIVSVGEEAVGKTCLLITYTEGKFPEDSQPTIFDNFSTTVIVQGKPVELNLWDTAGNMEGDRLRPLSYPATDIFLLVFAVSEPETLRGLKQTFIPEIRQHTKDVTLLLVGTKIDLRKDEEQKRKLRQRNLKPVSKEKGVQWAQHLGAAGYVECSAKTQKGVKQVFDKAVELVVLRKEAEKRGEVFGVGGGGKGLSFCVIL